MKQKILEALQQGYNNLGIGEKAFEGVAAFATTYVTEEAQIENFVKGAEPMLKAFQGDTDKLRSDYSLKLKDAADKLKAADDKVKELEVKLAGQSGGQGGQGNQGGQGEPKMEDIIKAAVDAALAPLNEKLTAMETEKSVNATTANAKTKFFANEWVKAYKEEGEEAWDRAQELYTAMGSKMSEEEFVAKAKGYFDKAVAKKGGDTSKPFQGGQEDDKNFDAESFAKVLKASGRVPEDKK